MQGVSQGQQRAYGAEANKTASRIQLYMTLALFLWIMREQWQMLVATMLAFLGALWYNQRSLIYMPNMPPESRTKFEPPEQHGLTHQELFFSTPDGERLQFWMFAVAGEDSSGKRRSQSSPTIVFFHGNAGNMSQRLPNIKDLFALGMNVCILSYRGYGKSTGTPGEAGMKIDGQAFVDFLTADPGCVEVLGNSPLVVFGRSIGGAVGVHVTRFNQDRLAGMIVENTFTNLEAMAGVIYPLLAPLLPLLLADKWWSNKLIGDIALPMLFMSAGRDEIVPPVQMQSLVQLARKARSDAKGDADTIELFSIPEGTHNDCFLRGGLPYYEKIGSFVASLPQVKAVGWKPNTITSTFGHLLAQQLCQMGQQDQALALGLPMPEAGQSKGGSQKFELLMRKRVPNADPQVVSSLMQSISGLDDMADTELERLVDAVASKVVKHSQPDEE